MGAYRKRGSPGLGLNMTNASLRQTTHPRILPGTVPAFCNRCGAKAEQRVPRGETLARPVCRRCGHIQYDNPKNVVAMIAEADDGRVLMCRRATHPGRGRWVFPGGFQENGETSAEGATRETREETRAEVRVTGLYLVINAPALNEVFLIHRGRLINDNLGPTRECDAVALMSEQDIPWQQLAFPAIKTCLEHYFEDRRSGLYPIHALDLSLQDC